jgi:hypothetical protein
MRFCRTLAIVAVVALAMVGAKVAKGDGAPDPKVHIVAPTDPVIEPCSQFAGQDITCFTMNSVSDPLVVAGPTLAEILCAPRRVVPLQILFGISGSRSRRRFRFP